MVSVDFFTVPSLTFHLLYVFIVLSHQRRRVLHFNVVENPSAAWTAQQLREAFPFASPPKYLLRDRDSIFGLEFWRRLVRTGLLTFLLTVSAQCPRRRRFAEMAKSHGRLLHAIQVV
jgi:hypothetical protein